MGIQHRAGDAFQGVPASADTSLTGLSSRSGASAATQNTRHRLKHIIKGPDKCLQAYRPFVT